MSESQSCICTTLRKASRAVTRIYDERLAPTGLTTTQFAVLRNLDRQGPMPLSRLAETLVMDRTSLYRTLGPIERHGWIAIGDQGHGRAKSAELTEAGRTVMASAVARWETAQTEIMDEIGPAQWRALEAQLRALADHSREKAA